MAIFQDQPISLQAIQGVNPEAFVQRAEREQQANAQQFQAIQQGIYQGIQNFENKRQEKQQKTASIEMLKQLGVVEGLSDKAIEAGINEVGAANFLKTLQDLETSSVNMEIAQRAAARQEADSQQTRALNKAKLEALTREPGEIKISPEGFVTQDGEYKTRIPQSNVPEAQAELEKTQAQIKQIEAETAAMGKPKAMTESERIRLIETKVGDVSFGEYLQELMQTKAIKGGELHQKGFFNFDEDQIAAFDDIIRRNPQFLEGMPDAVKEYYGSITLADDSTVTVTPIP
jgi:hypothetical protein